METTGSTIGPALLAALDDGVRGVEAAAAAVTDWRAPTACPDWTAVDLAGHLLVAAGYYHRLLDAAERGRPLADRPDGVELAAWNARNLAALDVGEGDDPPERLGPARIAAFGRTARAWHERLRTADADRPLAHWRTLGVLTVGEHAGVITGEWHLHAWDLGRAAGHPHRPADPATVLAARGRVLHPDTVVGSGDPWERVLALSGRSAQPERPS